MDEPTTPPPPPDQPEKPAEPKRRPKPWPKRWQVPRPKKPKLRKTILNQEIQDKVVAAIRAGNYIPVAAAFAGVQPSTVYRWLKKGSKRTARHGRYVNFAKAVGQAFAESEVRDVSVIAKASSGGDWKAAAWRLERRYPNRWGKREQVTVDGASKVTHQHLGLNINVIPANTVDRKTGALVDAEVVKELPPGEPQEEAHGQEEEVPRDAGVRAGEDE